MAGRITLVTQVDNMPTVQAWVKSIKKVKLYVGIIDDADSRSGSRIGNIALAAILENGAPSMNVPPRPFMKPGMDPMKSQARDAMKQAADMLYKKNNEEAREILGTLGRRSVMSIREVMESGVPPPLDQKSAERKFRKGYPDETLIKTGQLRDSISFKITGV
jgi:hypothetical protein